MEHLEVIIYDEINDYKEKIKGLTFRQWIFIAIGVALVVPTYIFLPKYTPISKDVTSYIVMFEAAIVGFFGFIKIQGLDAEKIVPYWYRHYVCYGKPLEYITDAEWKEMHESKKEKKAKQKQEAKLETNENNEITKKELKKRKKQQQMLEKAKAKYGYVLDEDDSKTTVNADDETIKNKSQAKENSTTEKNTASANELINSLTPEEKALLIARLMESDNEN